MALKQKKTAASEEQEEQEEQCNDEETESSGEEEMEEGVTDSQPLTDSPLLSVSQQDAVYAVNELRVFLKTTKNMKNVQYEEYFADKKLLVLSIRSQMNIRGEGGFTEQEYWRLKKIVLKLTKELNDEDSEGM